MLVWEVHGRQALRDGWVELVTAPVAVLELEFSNPEMEAAALQTAAQAEDGCGARRSPYKKARCAWPLVDH